VKLVYRHILSDLVPAFLLSVILFAGFIWIAGGPLLNAVNDLAKGVSFWIVAQLMSLFLPAMLVLAFPMAMLIAVILGFNRLSAESEAVAMFASGISFYQMLLPTAGFAIIVSIVAFLIGDLAAPAANARISYIKANITHELTATTDPFPILPPLRYSNGRLEALVWVDGGFDQSKHQLRGVTIIHYDPKTGLPTETIYAKSAQWLGGLNWRLQDGSITKSNGIAGPFSSISAVEIHQTPNAVALLADSSEADNLSFSELARQIAAAKREGGLTSSKLRDDEVSLWGKIALPCACLVFALVGAPLALKPQRSASRGAAAAYGVGLILAYYALFKYLDILGANGRIDPALAAFLPNLLGLALAAYLIAKVTT
jgi:lipopolysaccharide export system permease protein